MLMMVAWSGTAASAPPAADAKLTFCAKIEPPRITRPSVLNATFPSAAPSAPMVPTVMFDEAEEDLSIRFLLEPVMLPSVTPEAPETLSVVLPDSVTAPGMETLATL